MCVWVYVLLYVNTLPASEKTNSKCKEEAVRPKANRIERIGRAHITHCLVFLLFHFTCA